MIGVFKIQGCKMNWNTINIQFTMGTNNKVCSEEVTTMGTNKHSVYLLCKQQKDFISTDLLQLH